MSLEEFAKAAAESYAKTLPRREGKSTTIVAVTSRGTTLSFEAVIDPESLGNTQAKLLSRRDSAMTEFRQFGVTNVCAHPGMRPAIRAGIVLEYRYRFADGTPFVSFSIAEADCPQ